MIALRLLNILVCVDTELQADKLVQLGIDVNYSFKCVSFLLADTRFQSTVRL